MPDFAISTDPAVQAQLDRLAKLSPGGDRLGLDRITRLLDRLGRPQDRLPPVFHIAGTNGKGSTCAFLRAALEASGRTVHVFTSPHLVRFNERIRIAGRLIEDEALAALLAEVIDAGDGIEPSFFEVTTAVAFLAFARTSADAAVVEVGLGGRLDATNVVEHPLVCGIASLGIDHEAFLLAEEAGVPTEPICRIGYEKAGIAKPEVPLVIQRYPAPVEAVIAEAAAKAGAPLLVEGRDWQVDPGLRPTLPGRHQQRNASLAAAMLRAQQRLSVSNDAVRRGVAAATWPARMQRLDPAGPLASGRELWLDGAHNAAAAEALAEAMPRRMDVVLGILANKDAAAIVNALAPDALSFTFVPVPEHESHDPQVLAERFGGRAATSLSEAVDGLPGPVLIAGSLYLAGEVLRLNDQVPD